MNTVQECLRSLDAKKIAREYMARYQVALWEINDKELSVKEVENRYNKALLDYIEHLKTLGVPLLEDKKTYVFFGHSYMETELHEEVQASLVCLEELMEAKDLDNVSTYAYTYDSQEEIMGYLIADTEYTQKNIYDVMVQILWEASFFGYKNEKLEEARNSLEEAIKESEDENGTLYTLEDLKDHLGIEREEVDEEAEALSYKIREAFIQYNSYKKIKELSKLLECIDNTYTAIRYTEEDGSITLSMNEIDLVINAACECVAKQKLAEAILEYANDFIDSKELYMNAPNRMGHIIYVEKALALNDVNKIREEIKIVDDLF